MILAQFGYYSSKVSFAVTRIKKTHFFSNYCLSKEFTLRIKKIYLSISKGYR